MPYRTDYYGYRYITFMHLLSMQPRELPVILSSADIGLSTLRIQLFNGRGWIYRDRDEPHSEFDALTEAAHCTVIRPSLNGMAIEQNDDFASVFRDVPRAACPYLSALETATQFLNTSKLASHQLDTVLHPDARRALEWYISKVRPALKATIVSNTFILFRRVV